MIQINNLEGISNDALYSAWCDAFRDYPFSWTRLQFDNMLLRRGYVAALSFGAFDDGKLVSFILNGIGMFNGLYSAYDTGTGTIKQYRGQGLVTKIFETSLPHLRQQSVVQYVLEVLKDNTVALNIYREAGFVITRGLDYFALPADELKPDLSRSPIKYAVRPIGLDMQEAMLSMWDITPSWQFQFDCLVRQPEKFQLLGAFDGDALVGYGIIEPSAGDVQQLAVKKAYRRKGIGSALLTELLKLNTSVNIRAANIEEGYEPMFSFYRKNGLAHKGSQYEMVKNLR